MEKLKLRLLNVTAALLVTLLCGHPALADDTEVLIGSGREANVVFILDTSGSMNWGVAGRNSTITADNPTRISVLKTVFSQLMDDYDEAGMNVALMRFDSTNDNKDNNTGGSFITPMQELTSDSSGAIKLAVENLAPPPGTRTPLAETLYEAALFFRGEDVHFGNLATPNNVDGVLVSPDADGTDTYNSPISFQCQKNTIILLTDGEPNKDTDADDLIESLIDDNCSGNCLDELAGYLHDNDQSILDEDQTVETYTIGFGTDQDLLDDAASAGGGEYLTASNQDELAAAFEAALTGGIVQDANSSFSPPAMAVNAFNNISHTNNLYFTLFEPALGSNWVGNVKPFKLTGTPPKITDADGLDAINSADGTVKGTFKTDSRSFWSDTDDGGSIAAGGANGKLPNAPARNLYTYTGGYDKDSGVPIVPASSTLSDASNALKTVASSDLTADMLDVADADFDAVVTATRESNMNDPLHSKAALVTYDGPENDPDVTLFVATNGGFLHALDASTNDDKSAGREQFAFIPRELLPNLESLANDSGPHPYGLDGDITVWVQESSEDDDHTIEAGEGDHVYVYVGMRRGGSNYYALDVTKRDKPKLKWVIKGGLGGTTGFSELGQTWSKASLTTIKYGSGTKKVLIFGGGYDTNQDDHPAGADDVIGRAIFIVDADTGKKLWQADSTVIPEMTNSIPSDVRLFDSDFDGLTDRLYVGDMRGQIFRVDLDATLADSTGVRLANLGSKDSALAANNRRFFYPPDVVVTQQPGVDSYVSVNIGSGYRAGPLNPLNDDGTDATVVRDRFYSLRDPNVVGPIPPNTDGKTIFDDIAHSTDDDLYDVTDKSTLITDETIDENGDLNNSRGWFITLGTGFKKTGPSNGEKVLASSITLNGVIYFTTYTPPGSYDPTDCAPPAGTGNLYSVSLFNATPKKGDELADRVMKLDRPGIPSSPTVMFRENKGKNDKGEPITTGLDTPVCVGTVCEEPPNAFNMVETYWKD
jgi:type IV pilus assembly protein PilY1